VLAWGAEHRRDLPWRRIRDPWSILVAEVMLQQTQVPRVIRKWEAFLDAYPDPAACAAVPLADVLDRWHGLGYPRRARNLWLAARACAERHGGRLPVDVEALLALPGVGPYTARAVATFALEQDHGVVDTNIARVLARVVGERLTQRRAQAVADALVPPGESWAWNQTLMDVGALHCRPSPRCEPCPLASRCCWSVGGRLEPDPAVGTAHASARQARFEGSALRAGPVAASEVPATVGWPDDPARAGRVATDLVAEGLVTRIDDHYVLG